MSNVLSAYNPIFYAQEGLQALEKALGMASRVYRRLDTDKGRQPGDTITIRRPATFAAVSAPGTAQDLQAGSVDVKLDQWKEVKFALRDDELTYSGDRIVAEHIEPAAYAMADAIDQSLCARYIDIPWYVDFSSPAVVTDLTGARKALFDNKVPMNDLHFMIDGQRESELLALQAFSQFQGAGQAGVDTQTRGTLGVKYGMEFYANQNVPAHTSATVADLAGAVNNAGGYAAGATSMAVDGFTASAAFKAGDIVKVTGHTQQYVIAADVTLDGTGAGTITIAGSSSVQGGGLESAVVDNQVVTVVLSGGSGATKNQNLLFHRNAIALAMAPLSEMGNGRGAEIFTASDPITGLSLRARLFYDGDASKLYVSLDALWGVKTLNANMAVRARG